mgnify:CR=1 FL=1
MTKNKYLIATALAAFITMPFASNAEELPAAAPMAQEVQPLPAITNDAALDASIRGLQSEWAVIKYQEQNKDEQEKKMSELVKKATALSSQYPSYAEPKVWEAIITSSQAGIKGGLGALGLVKHAKELLEQAEKINPNALDGSIYTSLGSLYYQVPAWPVGFGDDKKARKYLEKAVAVNPNGIDPNYFYGDFLIEQDDYKGAIKVLEHALQAAPRPGRELADAGRKQEINVALNKAHHELGE